MAIIPWTHVLSPIILGTLGSLYFYPPAVITAESQTTHCYPYIYTLNDTVPNAKCFVVGGKEGRFLQVGNRTEGEAEAGGEGEGGDKRELKRDEAEGGQGGRERVVIPGLWDGHGHLLQLGEMLGSVKLYGAGSTEEVRTRIESRLKANPTLGTSENWIRGIGWDQSLLFPPSSSSPVPRMPTVSDLNSPLLADKYIMLDRVDVHCVWISSAVRALLPENLPPHSIPGGEIPTDGVFCDNAMDVVYNIYPDKIPSRKKILEQADAAMKALNKVGVVGVHDAGVQRWGMEGLTWLNAMGLMTVRVNAMVECSTRNTFCGDEMHPYMGKSHSGMLSAYGVKIFADGALGSWGAALLEGYTDKPETEGTLLMNSSALEGVITEWFNSGYQISTHCIGDRANRIALNTYANLLKDSEYNPPNAYRRLRIEHAQIIDPADQELMRTLGIIPSIQPTHATSDSAYAEKRLGKERLVKSAYRMKSLFEKGLKVVLGSDFPVESHDWRDGVYAAIMRKNPYSKEDTEGAFYPGESISVHQALEGFTKNVAYAAWAERDSGDISVGKWADWVVLEYEGEEVGPRFWEEDWIKNGGDVRKLKVVQTWVAGRKVYDSADEEEGIGGIAGGIRKFAEKGEGVMEWVQRVFKNSGI